MEPPPLKYHRYCLTIIVIITCCAHFSFAQRQKPIVSDLNKLQGGKDFVRIQVEEISPIVEGEWCLWDFHNLKIIDNNKRVQIKNIGQDSIIHIVSDRTAYKYCLRNDTLHWFGFENRLTKVSDSTGALVLKYPFVYGDSISSNYCLTGRYSKSTSYIEDGNIMTVADAYGTVVMPFDTIKDVIRLRTERKFNVLVADSVYREILNTLRDSLIRIETTIYRWYSQTYRYPIAEHIEYRFLLCDSLLYEKSQSFISESAYLGKEDYESDGIAILKLSHKKVIQENENNSGENDDEGVKINKINSSGFSVDFKLPYDCLELNVTVCDIQGRVFFYKNKKNIPAGVYTEHIHFSGFKLGQQYLFVVDNGKDIIRKELIEINP